MVLCSLGFKWIHLSKFTPNTIPDFFLSELALVQVIPVAFDDLKNQFSVIGNVLFGKRLFQGSGIPFVVDIIDEAVYDNSAATIVV